jgi:hypothetical protein
MDGGEKAVSGRQLETLVRIAARYARDTPGVAAALRAAGKEAVLTGADAQPPRESTLLKLECLAKLELDESTRKFVDSLLGRVQGGRRLTDAQSKALDNVIVGQRSQIDGFEEVVKSLGIELSEGEPDAESETLLGALVSVKEWRPPLKRGKREFNDERFYQSLKRHYAQKGYLSARQKSALKRLVGHYRSQIPDFDEIAHACGLKSRQGTRKGA